MLSKLLRAEPAAFINLVGAGLAMLVAFGFELSDEQMAAVLAFVTVLAGLLVRGEVYSPLNVEAVGDPSLVAGAAKRARREAEAAGATPPQPWTPGV